MDPNMKECIEDCRKCADICEETITHCLDMGGKHAEESHINLLKECITVCKRAEEAMTAGAPNHKEICAECAEVCRKCAESCESIDPEDEQMMRCAEMCKKCADSCEQMAE
jgi:hypothetical protein